MSKIEWITWNPIVGCSAISPGCANCYAMRMAAALQKINRTGGSNSAYVNRYDGTTQPSEAGPVWTGKVALAPEHILTAPLRWKRPRRIFVNSMGDLFHESVPDAWIDRVFAVMALAPQHTFQVLTKRSRRMREYLTHPSQHDILERIATAAVRVSNSPCAASLIEEAFDEGDRPLPNVWLGVSCEDQERADERIPDLLATPAAVRFVSAEPLLGPINIADAMSTREAVAAMQDNLAAGRGPIDGRGSLHWIIVGGESGPGARPMVIGHAREIVRQCKAGGVSCFVKQLGAKPVNREGQPHPQKHRKGADPSEWPEDLRVQEWPDAPERE